MTLSNFHNGLARIAAPCILAAVLLTTPGNAEAAGGGLMSAQMQSFASVPVTTAPVGFKTYTAARLVCINGKIASGNCYCGAGYRRFQLGPNKYKCMKMPGGYSRKAN